MSVLPAKWKCYPSKWNMSTSECSADVKLQALLDHTMERTLLRQIDVIKSLSSESVSNLQMGLQWLLWP